MLDKLERFSATENSAKILEPTVRVVQIGAMMWLNCLYDSQHNDTFLVPLCSMFWRMLLCQVLSLRILSVIMLIIDTLSVVVLRVILLSVVASQMALDWSSVPYSNLLVYM